MDVPTIISKLEAYDLQRVVVSTKQGDVLSYECNNENITINETTLTNLNRLCLLRKNNEIYLYVNNLTRRNLKKFNITTIETLQIT